MIQRKLFFPSVAVAFLLLVGFSPQTFACSCSASGPPCQAYWRSDAIFAGTPISSSQISIDEEGHKRPMRLFRLRVDEPFRGVTGQEIDIITGFGGGDCGYEFEKGKKYLVYGYTDPKQHYTYAGLCSRTRPMAEASEGDFPGRRTNLWRGPTISS